MMSSIQLDDTPTDALTIGQRIRAARKELTLSQEELADRLGVTQPTVANWESDAHNPRQLMLAKLSEALDVSLGWLAGGETIANLREKHPAAGYLSRATYHVPVLLPSSLSNIDHIDPDFLLNAAADFITVSGRSDKLFAAFMDPTPHETAFPDDRLFVFDYGRKTPVPGCYG
ncbi:MAG: helix-turn-helix transcriptional regulator, partial [Pseudomonadota bacterium]